MTTTNAMRIVTFASTPHYLHGTNLLTNSLIRCKSKLPLTVYRDYPVNCPLHNASPYAFKPFFLNQLRHDGAELVLWVDSSFRFREDPRWIQRIIESDHCFFVADVNHTLDKWVSDACLQYYGIERSELSASLPLFAGIIGLDLRSNLAGDFLDAWIEAERAGMFCGAWTNKDCSVSLDKSVKGHRHDQSCASLIVRKMKISPKLNNADDIRIMRWPMDGHKCRTARVVIDRDHACPFIHDNND